MINLIVYVLVYLLQLAIYLKTKDFNNFIIVIVFLGFCNVMDLQRDIIKGLDKIKEGQAIEKEAQ